MPRNWGRIARHYAASLTSYLFKGIYGIWRGAKTVYHFAKREYDKAVYNFNVFLIQTFLYPLVSIYYFFLGSYELGTGRTVPW